MGLTAFFIALLIGFIGAAIVFFSGEELKTNVITFFTLTVVYTLIGWWIIYASVFLFAGPLFGGAGVLLVFWWIFSAIVASFFEGEPTWSSVFPVGLIVVYIVIGISGLAIFRSSDYANLIGSIQDKTEKHWSQDIQPLDPTHIRLVPKELAISLAKTTLGQNGSTLGSQFPLDEEHATLQKINNDYWYLVPLDYKGWAVWTNADYVPGYVKVSATDPYAKSQLITGKKFKYTPGAYFGDNLERLLFSEYLGKKLRDFSFEEDDNGNVFWVITVCKPTIAFGGLVVEGVIVFNPETGEKQFVSQKEIKEGKFSWIDRVMPVELVKSYIDRWGKFKGGWWNSFWTHVNLLVAETPTMNYSADGRCVFVSPVTSSNDNDQGMTGLMYTDARTGKFVYYGTSGGATEQAVIDAVNSATSYKKWHGNSQIIYENVYGKLSSLVPILGENGNYQGLAIVENENKRVAIGTTPQEALIEFQKMLMSAGGQITTENSRNILEYKGKITRIGWDISTTGKQYYLYFNDFSSSFAVSSPIQSELALTKEGDLVYIKYIASDQVSVPTISFTNLSLSLRQSKNEKAVAAQISQRQKDVQIKADVNDFKESIKDMSDEELQNLMENQKKDKK